MGNKMKSMLLREITQLPQNPTPLTYSEIPEPTPAAGEVLLRVTAYGVCHTELDEIEGRTPPPRLPVVLGHQVVGTIIGMQSLPTLQSFQSQETLESKIQTGQRVGVAHHTLH